MKRDGAGSGSGSGAEGRAIAAGELDLRADLESVLVRAGLDAGSVAVFADSVLLAGAATSGDALAQVRTQFVPVSVADAIAEGINPEPGEPGSVTAFLQVADQAQRGVEAINQVLSRLERARLVAVAEGVSAMGRAVLAERGLEDPGELSATVRERWRWRVKARVRQDLAPATGWSKAETASVVAVATAPAAFRAPVASALSRGTASWVLVRGLWRACDKARLSAADAAHVAMVMLGDDPETCVPERLEADGSAAVGPWGHGAFWGALDREVTKLAACPDPEDSASVKAAAEARAAREAAYRARSMSIRVNEDGTAQVCFTGTTLKVLALGDRLDRAARAARGAGDARTVTQLANDIGIALLGHAVIGAHELPDLDIFASTTPTPEDLVAAGWTPQVIAALSALPAAVLQVIVPLLALHDPAAAHTLPGVHRTNGSEESASPADEGARDGAGEGVSDGAGETGSETGETGAEGGHTGAPGCPACLPSVRAARNRDIDQSQRDTDTSDDADPDPGGCPGEDSAHDQDSDPDPNPGADSAHDQDLGEGSAPDQDSVEGSARPRPPRVVWTARLLGKYPSFLAPDVVRGLGLSPGSTFVRLLVDPADGRCLERSIASYSFDAAMRTQLAAADVTCRAPGCEHHAGGCQVDHVIEHGIGGATKEANGQLLEVWHHDPKTAKAWDAVLHANRDVTWTTTLSRIFRTRVHDYRELVTVMTDALDRVAAVPEEDVADQINLEVYQALCYREAGERLNEGDDDTYEETHLARFGGEITLTLSHRDPLTGRRAPGPSPAAQDRADTTAAISRTRPTDDGGREGGGGEGGGGEGEGGEGGAGDAPRYPGGRRWHLTDRPTKKRLTPEERAQRAAERLRHDEGPPPF